jgi:hypothetical protein
MREGLQIPLAGLFHSARHGRVELFRLIDVFVELAKLIRKYWLRTRCVWEKRGRVRHRGGLSGSYAQTDKEEYTVTFPIPHEIPLRV